MSNTKNINDPTLRIIQQLLNHNSQLLHSYTVDTLFPYETLKTCFSDYIDYSEHPSTRKQNFQKNYESITPLLNLLLPYCDEFLNHPGTCYQWSKGNFYINIQWVKNTVEKVGYKYMWETHSTTPQRRLLAPFTGDYLHVMFHGGTYIFNYPHRDYQHDPNMMNINAVFQIFISDCLEGEKLYAWFYYFIAFLLLSLLSVLVTGEMKNVLSWCNPRFSHRYAPLVFYSLQETQLSGLSGIVDCNKSLLDWWKPIQHFYEDMVTIQCKRLKTV